MARILLVEDDAKLGAFFDKGLHQAGHVVEWVRDGQAGLERLLGGDFDASIIDGMLPELEGIELIAATAKKFG